MKEKVMWFNQHEKQSEFFFFLKYGSRLQENQKQREIQSRTNP